LYNLSRDKRSFTKRASFGHFWLTRPLFVTLTSCRKFVVAPKVIQHLSRRCFRANCFGQVVWLPVTAFTCAC